jgi:type IV pilus assembly protein PilM
MIALRHKHYRPIGLDLGPYTARLVQLKGPEDRLQIHAMAHCPIEVDQNATADDQDRQIGNVLKNVLANHPFKGRLAVSCLGAQDLFVQNVRLPVLPPEEVAKVVAWEAEERLPYPVHEAEIRHLTAGKVRREGDGRQEVILMSCHTGIVQRQIRIMEYAGLTPRAVDVEPCAVIRSLRFGQHAQTGDRCAYLNLGEKATTVVFAEDNRILFLKYIGHGGHHLDQAVARHLNSSTAEAARVRTIVNTASELDSDDEVHRTVAEAIRTPLESIAAEIELCLRYYKVTFRGNPLKQIIVTGNDASHWLLEFLENRLGLACEIGDPVAGLAVDTPHVDDSTQPFRWTTAIGLALK